MKLILIYFCVGSILLLNACSLNQDKIVSAEKMPPTPKDNHILQAYLPFWKTNFKPDPKVLSRYSHIALAFAYPKENGEVTYDRDLKEELDIILNSVKEAKKINPNLKCLWAVGGWSDSKNFSSASSDQNRKNFVANLIKLVDTYNCDGVDLDWEFPTKQNKENYTKLIKDLRAEIDRQKKPYEISIAVAGSDGEHSAGIDLKEVIGSINHLNLMTYDYYGSWSENAGHHTGIFKSNRVQNTDINVDSGVKYYLENGVAADKIVIGAAFYGRIQGNVAAGKTGDGLGEKSNGTAKINCQGQETSDEISYDCLKTLPPNDWKPFFDDEAKSPYLYNAQNKTFISYDNPRSLQAKIDLVKSQKLGGMMIWELSEDSNNELSNVLFNGFGK